MIALTLPFPPSVNCLYAGKGRRYKSKQYEKWIIQARNALIGQTFAPFVQKKPLQVIYIFGRPDKRRRDAANYIKAVDDLLTSQGVIPDDSWIHRGIFEWGDSDGVTVEITLLAEKLKR